MGGRPAGQRPLTIDQHLEIIRRYLAGETIKALAEAYQRGTPAVRKILADAGVRIRNQSLNTPIELRLHDALRNAQIGFNTQRMLVGRYLADIDISQAPIVIEADGWQHQLPEQKAKDAKRDTAFIAAGYRVFRFSGSEINTDAAACVQRVIDACGLVPDTDPVFEVCTSLVGATHPRWKGGKREFTCTICGKVFLAQPTHRKGPDYYCSVQCAGAARRGKRLSAEHRASIGAGVAGKPRKSPPPVTAEHRANLRAALTGKPKSAEHVAKVAAAQRGRPKSPETRAKISATLKLRNAS